MSLDIPLPPALTELLNEVAAETAHSRIPYAANRETLIGSLRKSSLPARSATGNSYESSMIGFKAIIIEKFNPLRPGLSLPGWLGRMVQRMTDASSEDRAAAMAEQGKYQVAKYYVWIPLLDKNKSVPKIANNDGGLYIQNVRDYSVAQVENILFINQPIPLGSLVRVNYENADKKTGLYVTSIISSDPDLARSMMGGLGAMSAQGNFTNMQRCWAGASLTDTQHSTGDPVGSSGGLAKLHNAYIALNKKAGTKDLGDAGVALLYKTLLRFLPDKNLVLGILANAYMESGFDANIVSGVSTESSIGLWQMNVQSSGKYDVPNSSRLSLAKSAKADLPEEIQIPKDAAVVPYFAGGLLLTAAKITVISPAKYDGTQDLTASYDTVRNQTKQMFFVIKSVKKMLASTKYNATTSKITAKQWAYWFQIYFEQPAEIHDRTAGVTASAEAAGVTV